jgi:ribosome-binding factor A
MSNRTIRIAELVQRELGLFLHTKYQSEAVTITVAGVEVSPDLKTGKIYFSILGDEAAAEGRLRWLKQKAGEIRRELAHRVKIKHSPEWTFLLDQATPRGNRILGLLDDLARQEGTPEPE